MQCVDVNVLIYAAFASSPRHEEAVSELEGLRRSGSALGLPTEVMVAFVRLVTDRRIWPEPMPPDAAVRFLDELLATPTVSALSHGPRHSDLFLGLVREHGLRGPEVPDASLAALAIERGATLVSYDRGFARFRGLRWVNPVDREQS